ncbi:hypothetical protein [Microbacterium sp. KNMS]
MSIPSNQTPNVVIENPKTRRVIRTVLDVLGLALATTVAVDLASEAFDIVAFTAPITAGLIVLRSGVGLGIDNPNTPTA